MFGFLTKLFDAIKKPMSTITPVSKAFASSLFKDALPATMVGTALFASGEHIDEIGKSVANSLGR